MAESVITREEKRRIAGKIKHDFGVIIPQRRVDRLSLNQMNRILAILEENDARLL